MTTKLIRLDDDVLIEVEAEESEYYPISSSRAERIERSFEDTVRPMLAQICRQVVATWRQLDPDLGVQQAEVELGLSFEGEGNLFISKAKTGANLRVRLMFTPGS